MTIAAHVVCDSISDEDSTPHRITSVQITAHRFILAEINTHRKFSRSYRSSRAVPVHKLIEEVRTNPAMPFFWGKNKPGMQADQELTGDTLAMAKQIWRASAEDAVMRAHQLAETGMHKQIANRVLEPYMWAHGVITSTEWDNFFGLRLHSSAQPEFRELANKIWYVMKESTPAPLRPNDWHMPYAGAESMEQILDSINKYGHIFRESQFDPALSIRLIMSTARCARSSYKPFDADRPSTFEEDMVTYQKLNLPGTSNYNPTQPIHASPAEHQATPDTYGTVYVPPYWEESEGWQHADQHGNFTGFRQHRKMLQGEAVAPLPEQYLSF